MTGARSVAPLAVLGCLALVITGCGRPGLALGIGLGIGAAIVAGESHRNHSAQPDVPSPTNPCHSNPEICK